MSSLPWQAADLHSVNEYCEETAMSFYNQGGRMTLSPENYSLKDTNSWTTQPDNFSVYTNMLV